MSLFDFPLTSLITTLVVNLFRAVVLLSIGLITYRITWHPLSKFPGPVGAKISSAWGFWYVWRRNFHLMTVGLHERYGPVVRIAPNRLLFNSASSVADIHNNPRTTKGTAYIPVQVDPQTPNLLTANSKTVHRQKRRIIAPVVSDRSMRVFESTMVEQINVYLKILLDASRRQQQQKQASDGKNAGVEGINMSPICERLAVDIIGQLAFGFQLDSQTHATHRSIVEGIKSRGARATLYFFWERLAHVRWLVDRLVGAANIQAFYLSLGTMISTRMKMDRDAKHDFYAFTSAEGESASKGDDEDEDGPQKLSGKALWAEAILFIGAGGSTTATALSGMMFYLSRNPDAYASLAREIRSTFASGDEIRQGPKLGSCKYLRAVIDETMRLSPSTLAVGWRTQDPASIAKGETFVVDGHVIPPGTQVGVSNYALQHDEKIFPEPYRFLPDRWIVKEEDPSAGTEGQQRQASEELTQMRRAFAPFSLGERNCAGRPMAYLEMSLVLAMTIFYFDFEKAPDASGALGGGKAGAGLGREREDEFQLYEGFIVGHNGPGLVFKLREGVVLE